MNVVEDLNFNWEHCFIPTLYIFCFAANDCAMKTMTNALIICFRNAVNEGWNHVFYVQYMYGMYTFKHLQFLSYLLRKLVRKKQIETLVESGWW